MPPNTSGLGGTLSGAGSILGGIGQLFSAGTNLWSSIKGIKLAKKQLNLAKDQNEKENARYEAREKERKESNAAFASSAGNWYDEMYGSDSDTSSSTGTSGGSSSLTGGNLTGTKSTELPTQRA